MWCDRHHWNCKGKLPEKETLVSVTDSLLGKKKKRKAPGITKWFIARVPEYRKRNTRFCYRFFVEQKQKKKKKRHRVQPNDSVHECQSTEKETLVSVTDSLLRNKKIKKKAPVYNQIIQCTSTRVQKKKHSFLLQIPCWAKKKKKIAPVYNQMIQCTSNERKERANLTVPSCTVRFSNYTAASSSNSIGGCDGCMGQLLFFLLWPFCLHREHVISLAGSSNTLVVKWNIRTRRRRSTCW